jgi:anti-sigma factor RsiW
VDLEGDLRLRLAQVEGNFATAQAQMTAKYDLDMQQLKAEVERLGRENARLIGELASLSTSMATLSATTRELSQAMAQAITPSSLRNWILAAAGLVSAIVLLMGALNSYNQAQILKHEEQRWLNEQRQNNQHTTN